MGGDEFLRSEDDAAEAAALPVDMLGRGVDDDVGAERQRALQHRGGEDVVDDQLRADRKFVDETLTPLLRHTGPTLSAFNAWVLLKGLETLDLRVREHCANAATVADRLAAHRRVRRVLYPGRADHPQHALAMAQMSGGGSVIAFEVAGDKAATFAALDRLQLVDISNNLGDAKSLVTHPATTTHQRLTPEARAELGISEGFIRYSAGLEHVDDLIEDFAHALDEV